MRNSLLKTKIERERERIVLNGATRHTVYCHSLTFSINESPLFLSVLFCEYIVRLCSNTSRAATSKQYDLHSPNREEREKRLSSIVHIDS